MAGSLLYWLILLLTAFGQAVSFHLVLPTQSHWNTTGKSSVFDALNVCKLSRERLVPKVHIRLYASPNPQIAQIIGPPETGNKGTFNGSKPVIIFTHGFQSSADYISNTDNLLNNTLAAKDWNVIFLDWSDIASDIFYPCVAKNALDVGEYLAEVLDWLVEECGANASNIHLVGHSLGAHISGRAASKMTRGRISRITGLDPAGPYFSEDEPWNRLDPGDAEFVDVIHTCGCRVRFDCCLGVPYLVGHADFFPNGGKRQRECRKYLKNSFTICGDMCSHHASISYFSESLLDHSSFLSYRCGTFSDYQSGLCFIEPTTNNMGMGADPQMKGKFYLTTREREPFDGRQIMVSISSANDFFGNLTLFLDNESSTLIDEKSITSDMTLNTVVAVKSAIQIDNVTLQYTGLQSVATLDFIRILDPFNNQTYFAEGPIDLEKDKIRNIEIALANQTMSTFVSLARGHGDRGADLPNFGVILFMFALVMVIC